MVCGGLTLFAILDDIFYLTTYTNLTGEYIDNITDFEREFYVQSLIKKIKKENEKLNGGSE